MTPGGQRGRRGGQGHSPSCRHPEGQRRRPTAVLLASISAPRNTIERRCFRGSHSCPPAPSEVRSPNSPRLTWAGPLAGPGTRHAGGRPCLRSPTQTHSQLGVWGAPLAAQVGRPTRPLPRGLAVPWRWPRARSWGRPCRGPGQAAMPGGNPSRRWTRLVWGNTCSNRLCPDRTRRGMRGPGSRWTGRAGHFTRTV